MNSVRYSHRGLPREFNLSCCVQFKRVRFTPHLTCLHVFREQGAGCSGTTFSLPRQLLHLRLLARSTYEVYGLSRPV